MSCNLHLSGARFDVDAFLAQSGLQPYQKGKAGDPVWAHKPDGKRLKDSYCSFEASRADFDAFEEQVADVIRFLEENKDQLSLVTNTPEIEEALLDFGIELRIGEHVAVQFDRLPARLLKLAGELGIDIGLSLYPPALEDADDDGEA